METGIRGVLTRHFFRSLFDFGFLSEEGAESFKRLLLGIAAVGLGLGLLLLRAFAAKYINLAGGPLELYERALWPDHAFLIAVPMWIAAAAVVCVGHSLFPDELDFRILMAQPVTRAEVFSAKLVALIRFVGLIVLGVHAALAPLTSLTIFNWTGGGGLFWNLAALAIASLAASGFAVMAVVAIHGLIVLLAPRSRLVAFAALVRSLLLGTLVLVVPLLLRLPGTGRAFASDASWLAWAPPAWFVALERVLTGDPTRASHALIGVAAVLSVSVVAAGTYALLYRRFDRVTVRPASRHVTRSARAWRWWARRPVRLAVAGFARITLGRSVFHQGIIVALMAAVAGLVVNDLYVQFTRPAERRNAVETATWSLLWAPFALMLVSSVAVRLALMLPLELRANWVFRMTEDPATRADAVGATVSVVYRIGVVLPVLSALPVQAVVLGEVAVIAVAVELAVGWLFVEFLMQDWRRLPFTCAYVPGKGFAPQMFVRGLFGFTAFTTLGAALVYGAVREPTMQIIAAVVTLIPAWLLLSRRRRTSAIAPFTFEDELPTEIRPLRLHE